MTSLKIGPEITSALKKTLPNPEIVSSGQTMSGQTMYGMSDRQSSYTQWPDGPGPGSGPKIIGQVSMSEWKFMKSIETLIKQNPSIAANPSRLRELVMLTLQMPVGVVNK